MPCYARACRRVRPCPSQRSCERVWHLCETSMFRNGTRAACPVCHTVWTRDDGNEWHRDALLDIPEDSLMSDRTVHAETKDAFVVRYDRRGTWHVEDKGPLRQHWGQRLRLPELVDWLQDQDSIGELVAVHYGLQGGRQFDKRCRDAGIRGRDDR